jgi:arylsulfatase A-like enzyme
MRTVTTMKRLTLILSLLLGSGFWALLSAAERPNIVLLFADDLGRYASAYAHPDRPSVNDIVSTPTFDRIAKEGVLAFNALVSAPSCSPSRAALISGRHFFRNGSHSQLHTPWHGDRASDPWNEVRGFALILQDAGYHIGWSHKMHIAEDRMGGKQNNFRPAGGKVNQFSQNVSKVIGTVDGASETGAIQKGKQKLYAECRDNFKAFLGKRKPNQPFYYSFHPTNPHRKWTKGSGKKLWGLDPDDLKEIMPPFLPDVHEVREDLADYLGEGMAFDRCCKEIIAELEKVGELDNTLLVISGDHGAPGFPRGKTNCYDFGARVLFAARWPGKIMARQVVTRPISLIDLAPTFLAAAGLEPEKGTNGQNLLPAFAKGDHKLLRGWALIGRETHVNTARGGLPYPTRALRTEDYLIIVNFEPDRAPMGEPLKLADPKPPTYEQIENNTRLTYGDVDAGPTKAWMIKHRADPGVQKLWDLGFGPRPREEFYDLTGDPHQVNNLSTNPAYDDIREALREMLMKELRANKDPRLEGDTFDKEPYNKRTKKGQTTR